MSYLLIFISVVFSSLSTVCQKNYMIATSNIKTSLNLYMLIAHPFAAIYFFCLAKGSVPLNTTTFVFSFFYSFTCIASVVLSMMAFQRISLVYISVFGGAGSVIIPFLFETFFHSEAFSVYELISVISRIIAVLIPLFMSKKGTKETHTGFFLCILLFLNGGIGGIILKLFAEHPMALSNNSFCFWTNIIIIPIISIAVLKTDGIKNLSSDVKKINPAMFAYILAGTAFGNLGSLIKLQTLKSISATIYSVLFSSLSMLLTTLISIFIYKEKVSKQMSVSVGFSILAVIFGVFK